MNEFKQNLKVNEEKKENGFREKISSAVIDAIANIETSNKYEEVLKIEYMINLRNIMDNYEELRPTLTEFFRNKRWRER